MLSVVVRNLLASRGFLFPPLSSIFSIPFYELRGIAVKRASHTVAEPFLLIAACSKQEAREREARTSFFSLSPVALHSFHLASCNFSPYFFTPLSDHTSGVQTVFLTYPLLSLAANEKLPCLVPLSSSLTLSSSPVFELFPSIRRKTRQLQAYPGWTAAHVY